MKRLSVVFLACVMLAACSRGPSVGADLEQKLENPLYAQRYYGELVDHMVNLVIHNDPLTKSGATQKIIDTTRVTAMDRAREASMQELQGLIGSIVSDRDFAIGEVLVLGNKLFLGPDFVVVPGVNLHAYLTNALDPRDGPFPDESAVDLGALKDPFGAQQYDIPADIGEYRTLVLWDDDLGLLYGFAQLRKQL